MQIKRLILGLILLIILSISACQNPIPTQPTSTQTPTTLPTFTALPAKGKKEAIIKQIAQLVELYNSIIETEKKTGSYEVTTLPDGTEGFLFTGKSLIRVYQEEEPVQIEIAALNEQYYLLAMQENPATPTPNPLAQSGDEKKLDEEHAAWYTQELQHGSFVSVYFTANGLYQNILIGDSYIAALQKEHESAIARAKLNNLSDKLIELDIQQIRKLENSDGDVKFIDIGSIPYYSLNLKLSNYETQSNTYVLYSQTHQIVEIAPKQSPLGSEGSAQDLEQKAREMIVRISPDVNFDVLILTQSQKTGAYFFHWEDHSRFLDDGHSYPSVQIGLNGKGELLSYYNTLPLAK